MNSVIEFNGVWKNFPRHNGRLLLRAHLGEFFKTQPIPEPFHALKNVSFRVDHGESLAVLGGNGAGKSTLLSLVAGLTLPDRGVVNVTGRLAALLDLGSGFHPDLTGVENVQLNAALLGIDRSRLTRVFPEIVDFAELGDFINEPLRTYSTGMMMRLAFSVAVHIDPDILLIDEVLAVGDQAFQVKCFERVLDFRSRGKTILCVSHALGMLHQLCNRAIWLDHGRLLLDGLVGDVIDAYEGSLQADTNL